MNNLFYCEKCGTYGWVEEAPLHICKKELLNNHIFFEEISKSDPSDWEACAERGYLEHF